MFPSLIKFFTALLYDEMKFRRWLRVLIMALATGGMGFADQLAAFVNAPVKWIKIISVIAGGISVAINLGEKNKPAEDPEAKISKV